MLRTLLVIAFFCVAVHVLADETSAVLAKADAPIAAASPSGDVAPEVDASNHTIVAKNAEAPAAEEPKKDAPLADAAAAAPEAAAAEATTESAETTTKTSTMVSCIASMAVVLMYNLH